MCTAHDLFEKSQLNQGIVRKFNDAIVTRRGGILQKRAIGVFTDLFRSQNFGSYVDANDFAFPIELVLLNIAKAIRLIIDWCPEWWWRDLFFSRGIIE